MITFYKINGQVCFSDCADLGYEKTEDPKQADRLTWLFQREPGSSRASFKVSDPALLSAKEENVSWLNSNRLGKLAPVEDLPDWVDLNYLYETDMDGETVSYVEIAAWAEEQWTDQLTACGFIVEEMAGENLTADGDCLLLFFFWN